MVMVPRGLAASRSMVLCAMPRTRALADWCVTTVLSIPTIFARVIRVRVRLLR